MKPKLSKIDILAIVVILVLVLGIICSYYNLGALSVFLSVSLPVIFIINSAFAIYGIIKKKYFYLIGVILFLFFFNFFYKIPLSYTLDEKETISALSFNVRAFKEFNSTSLRKKAPEIIKFIDSINPDILVLQESAYKEGIKIKGYSHQFLGYREDIEKTLLIIYSKYPIINQGHIDFPNTKNNGIYADLKVGQDTLRIYNTHLQSFSLGSKSNTTFFNQINETISKQLEQARLIKSHANNSNKKTIICGDFNTTAYGLPYRILKDGLNDSFNSNGNGFGRTYQLFNYPLRLDYFLYDNHIEVFSHENFNLSLSDHEPVLIKFKINQ